MFIVNKVLIANQMSIVEDNNELIEKFIELKPRKILKN